MKRVVLIHGIKSDGQWASRLRPFLEPFFEVEIHEYPYFRDPRVGGVDLLINLSALAWGLAATALMLSLHFIVGLPAWPAWTVLAGAALIGLYRAGDKRRRAHADLLGKLMPAGPVGLASSVVAHSFGTYLTCSVLEEVQLVRLDVVVFAGSVAKRRFPWGAFRRRVGKVLNFVGSSDPVARFTAMLERSPVGMGSSGRLGFMGDESDVHSIDAAIEWWCGTCRLSGASRALVHNLKVPFAAHEVRLDEAPQLRNLLPSLCGWDVEEFHAVTGAAEFLNAHPVGSAYSSGVEREVWTELFTRACKSLNDRSIGERLDDMVRQGCIEHGKSGNQIARAERLALHRFILLAAEANAELRRTDGPRGERLRCLDLSHAVREAAILAVREV